MRIEEAYQLLEGVTDAISSIDQRCRTVLGDVQHGLVNVKLEFKDQALRNTGKRLTEEQLIAWLVQRKLVRDGYDVLWELPYPQNHRRKCDLVICKGDSSRMWLELKLAWKAWFNCIDEPTYSNRSYLPYLQGHHHTHSFRHDFDKLSAAHLPHGDCRAVCLVGFDCTQAPMDEEVEGVVDEVRQTACLWTRATERHWSDRRCRDFRINVWSWVLHTDIEVRVN